MASTDSKLYILALFLFLASNLISIYVGFSWKSSTGFHLTTSFESSSTSPSVSSHFDFSNLLSELNITETELQVTQSEVLQLRQDIETVLELAHNLLENGTLRSTPDTPSESYEHHMIPKDGDSTNTIISLRTAQTISEELHEYIGEKKLPLGWSSGLASSTMVSPIGHSCELVIEDLLKYMDYEVGGPCPDDQGLAQSLMVHGCEPLPRRRCFAKAPESYKEPYPRPESMWTMPKDESILWTPYTCKSFECLNDRKNKGVFEDCIDCFELDGREWLRWTERSHQDTDLDYSVEEVLEMKNGTIRVGLDIGGGTASFAVRMMEHNVTIITSSLNLNGPFNSFIALRGVVPLYISIAQRLPFFDNTLDLIHSMHVLSNWIPITTLEFVLFDIDRVLRPGGILWLDHFFCLEPQLEDIYLPLFHKLGYKKLRLAIAPKLDRGADLHEVYLSALLEKPFSR